LSNDEHDFPRGISAILKRLTTLMDQMKEELKHNDSSEMKRALRALVSSQGQMLKAFFSLDTSYRVPQTAGETWEHFLAKNCLIKGLSSENIFPEVGIGGCVFDVVAKIGGEYVIIETETKTSKCIEKTTRIKKTIGEFLSEKVGILEQNIDSIFSEIKKQLEDGKPVRLIFVVTRKPNTSTLREIKKVGDAFLHPEVYYVSRIPPFQESSNLLEEI